MNDTQRIEAKLNALIDALGFDVEEILLTEFVPAGFNNEGTSAVFEHKLTKRNPEHCSVDKDVWGHVVDFVLAHQEDIVNDINDYGGLGLVLDSFSSKCGDFSTIDEVKGD